MGEELTPKDVASVAPVAAIETPGEKVALRLAPSATAAARRTMRGLTAAEARAATRPIWPGARATVSSTIPRASQARVARARAAVQASSASATPIGAPRRSGSVVTDSTPHTHRPTRTDPTMGPATPISIRGTLTLFDIVCM